MVFLCVSLVPIVFSNISFYFLHVSSSQKIAFTLFQQKVVHAKNMSLILLDHTQISTPTLPPFWPAPPASSPPSLPARPPRQERLVPGYRGKCVFLVIAKRLSMLLYHFYQCLIMLVCLIFIQDYYIQYTDWIGYSFYSWADDQHSSLVSPQLTIPPAKQYL